MTIRPKDIIVQFLHDSGESILDATGDYSSVNETIFCGPPAGDEWLAYRVIVSIEGSSGNFQPSKYGDLSALSNGVIIRFSEDPTGSSRSTSLDLTDGEPIHSLAEWAALSHEVTNHGISVSGDDEVTIDFDFGHFGGPVRLIGDNGDRLEVFLQDNFTGLVEHRFSLQGVRVV